MDPFRFLLVQLLLILALFEQFPPVRGQFPCGFRARDLGGFSNPVDICQLDNERLLVVEKRGTVVLIGTSGSVAQKRVLDVSGRVRANGEGGLLSCAVDPDFPAQPYVYFGYITNGGGAAGQKRVSRFTYDVSGNSFVGSSELVLVGDCAAGQSMCMPQAREFHTTVSLQFGPDGNLFVATGDQSTGGAASQDVSDQSTGKILRINRSNGQGFADNPFCNGGALNSPRCRVFAYGFRNPWTFDFVPGTSDLLVFHVGDGAFESAIYVSRGTNAGYPCFEGRSRRRDGCSGFDASRVVFQYPHNGNGASISGGTFFGSKFPARYSNSYLFADYVRGTSGTVPWRGGFTSADSTSFGSMRRVSRIKKGRTDGLVYVLRLDSGLIQLSWNSAAACDGIGPWSPPSGTVSSRVAVPTTTGRRIGTTRRTTRNGISAGPSVVPKTSATTRRPIVPTTRILQTAQRSSNGLQTSTTSLGFATTAGVAPTGASRTIDPFCSPTRGPVIPQLMDSGFSVLQDVTELADIDFRSNGFGPIEINSNVGGAHAMDGRPITIGGYRFPKGFGTRVPSEIVIPLKGLCSRFEAFVGIDDSGNGRGWAEALVFGDGRLLVNTTAQIGVLRNRNGAHPIALNVTGVSSLRLVGAVPFQYQGASAVALRNSNLIWAMPRLLCGPTSPFLPAVRIFPQFQTPEISDVGAVVTFRGRAFSARGWPLSIQWTVNLWHCQGALCHAHPAIATGYGRDFSYTLIEHEDCVFFEIRLGATDICGRSNFASHFIRVASAEKYCVQR
ncbi:Sorbosone dehydrogenase-domain-containing protein [Hyaloraphidium curvatum]|nr:Sorbosone dehydrogenase-domain-containing protein [Hyaloraphidium curvatum]